MPVHPRVRAWVAQNYQRPAIDQEWLADCADWVAAEFSLDPDTHFDQFVHHIDAQLLQSNLADSTVPGSGIDPLLVAANQNPARPRRQNAPRQKKTTGTPPLLVEITSITEIAHSAFALLNTHQTRLDRADLGLAREENVEQLRDQDEGPVPRFPRGMLRFELSDGLTTFRAIEFRSLPELELGSTPLGYKMFLNSTPIRDGIAFLEPANVIHKGYRTEDHDVNREQVFLSSLRKRLRRPDPPPEEPIAAPPSVHLPARPAALQPAGQHQIPPAARPPSPPADIDDMYVDDDVDPDVLREMAIQMDQIIDTQENKGTRTLPSSKPSAPKENNTVNSNSEQTLHLNTDTAHSSLNVPSTSFTVKSSPYFTAHASESNLIPDIGLSPRSALPPDLEPDFDIPWDIDDPEPPKIAVQRSYSTSAKPSSAAPTTKVIQTRKRSPDFFDDLSFDMDVDESFLEQVGMMEKGALGAGRSNKGKGKSKDTGTEGPTLRNRSSAASGSKTSPTSAFGTKHLVIHPVSFEPGKKAKGNVDRAASASSHLSGSTESFMPHSTQSSDHRLPHDPSLIVISSEEEEVKGDRDKARPLDIARGYANKRRKRNQEVVVNLDVIDISE